MTTKTFVKAFLFIGVVGIGSVILLRLSLNSNDNVHIRKLQADDEDLQLLKKKIKFNKFRSKTEDNLAPNSEEESGGRRYNHFDNINGDQRHRNKDGEDRPLNYDESNDRLRNDVENMGKNFASDPIVLSERLVHFDLKGAPPRVDYFKKLFPYLRKFGATGVLIEWEDMLPYAGSLEITKSGYAYSREDVVNILSAAEENHLKVIPLVQTFGHMEWLLKHKKFVTLREVIKYPQVICPNNPDTMPIIKELIDQVVELHPGIDTLHIGADEAYYVGKCSRCKKRLQQLDDSKDRLMLEHVKNVAAYANNKHKVKVLMWNDMFQHSDPELLTEVANLVEPVIWGYSSDLIYSDYFPSGLFQRFGQTFNNLWIASAFKGANGPDQTFIDVERYLQVCTAYLCWFLDIRILVATTVIRFPLVITKF